MTTNPKQPVADVWGFPAQISERQAAYLEVHIAGVQAAATAALEALRGGDRTERAARLAEGAADEMERVKLLIHPLVHCADDDYYQEMKYGHLSVKASTGLQSESVS